uniref:Phage terminase large subunit protein n=1 Tax=uncultured bacterium CSLF43 TaxID=1091575 RepID=G4WW19_9BACT|nr:phage terminase large subunit protein [uncultured bacterium CSLF43]
MGRTNNNGIVEIGIEYSPLPSQDRFHRSVARFKGFSGPIGCGKSQALCQEAVRLTYQNPGRMGLIGAPTYPMLRDATQRTLFEILDESGIRYEFNKAENFIVMKDSRSKIVFRSLDDYERLRGTNLAWFGVDELTYTVEEAWLRLEGRLRDPKASRLCGFAVWTPKGFDWVYDRFVANPVTGYAGIVAKPFENRFLLDKIPDFYERLRSSYDERFFQQEVMGEYLNLSAGRVYYAFERQKHLRTSEVDTSRPLLWALDFNVNPMCSLIAQKIGDTIVVHDEVVLSRASTNDACEEFQRRFGYHAAGIEVYGDASGARMQTAGATDYEIITDFLRRNAYQHVMKVPRSNPAVRDRVAMMNAAFENVCGQARLFVDPRCKELIKDFEQVGYQPNTTMIDKMSDPRRTHLSDALGYLVWQESREPIGERGERLF